jgi:hypothetical protein
MHGVLVPLTVQAEAYRAVFVFESTPRVGSLRAGVNYPASPPGP